MRWSKIYILSFAIFQIAQASNKQMSEFTQNLILAIIVSIITAILTVKLSMRQFYSQRWWEKKAEAYSQILETLSEFVCCIREIHDAYEKNLKMWPEDKERLKEILMKTKEIFGKVIVIGTHTISSKACNALSKYIDALSEFDIKDDIISDLNRMSELTYNFIQEIKNCEKKDLKIK